MKGASTPHLPQAPTSAPIVRQESSLRLKELQWHVTIVLRIASRLRQDNSIVNRAQSGKAALLAPQNAQRALVSSRREAALNVILVSTLVSPNVPIALAGLSP